MKRGRIIPELMLMSACALIVTVGCAAAGPTRGNGAERVKTGTWGGTGAALKVTDAGAKIESDCANGQIPGPLTLDADGRFAVEGTWTAEHAGPVRIDEEPVAARVRYSGLVSGSTMTLDVSLIESGQSLGSFTLKLGSDGALRKCR
jgi:hypothetical protein